ncbi:MAG: hypothetical protein Q9212_003721 [Teloschistes hypoglaucus]
MVNVQGLPEIASKLQDVSERLEVRFDSGDAPEGEHAHQLPGHVPLPEADPELNAPWEEDRYVFAKPSWVLSLPRRRPTPWAKPDKQSRNAGLGSPFHRGQRIHPCCINHPFRIRPSKVSSCHFRCENPYRNCRYQYVHNKHKVCQKAWHIDLLEGDRLAPKEDPSVLQLLFRQEISLAGRLSPNHQRRRSLQVLDRTGQFTKRRFGLGFDFPGEELVATCGCWTVLFDAPMPYLHQERWIGIASKLTPFLSPLRFQTQLPSSCT